MSLAGGGGGGGVTEAHKVFGPQVWSLKSHALHQRTACIRVGRTERHYLNQGRLELSVTRSGSNCHHMSPDRMQCRAEGYLGSVLEKK